MMLRLAFSTAHRSLLWNAMLREPGSNILPIVATLGAGALAAGFTRRIWLVPAMAAYRSPFESTASAVGAVDPATAATRAVLAMKVVARPTVSVATAYGSLIMPAPAAVVSGR